MSETIERKRAIRSANRGVLTKYMKESIEHMNGDIDQSILDRLTTLDKLLNEKLALVKKLDDEILEECDIKDIEKDMEESEEITSRVYESKNKIEKLCAKEHQVQSIPVAHKNTTISEPLNSQPSLADISTESVSGHLNQESYQVSMAQFVPKTRLPKLSLLKFNGEITKFRTFGIVFKVLLITIQTCLLLTNSTIYIHC